MKEYLEKKKELLNARLKEIQSYLDGSKKLIIKKDKNGEPVVIGFKYQDRRPTKSNSTVRAYMTQRDKIKRKIRRINKKLASA